MEGIQGAAIQLDVNVMQVVNADQAVADTVNAVCKLNRTGTLEPLISMAQLAELLDISNKSPSDWMRYAFQQSGAKSTGPLTPDLASVVFAGEVGQNRAVEALNYVIKWFFAQLLVDGIGRDDWGSCVFKDITENSDATGLRAGTALLPATGYPRSILLASTQFFPGAEKAHLIPHISSTAVSQLALLMMRLDMHKYRFSMFAPPEKDEHGIDVRRDKLFGESAGLIATINKLWEFSALYRVSAARMIYAFHSRIREKNREQYRERISTAMDAYELDVAAEKEFLALPIHPLGSYIENAFKTGQVETQYGEHPALWASKKTVMKNFVYADAPAMGVDADCGDSSALFALNYERYLKDLMNANILADGCIARGWDVINSRSEADEQFETVPSFMARIKGVKDLTASLTRFATELGWSAISADIGTLQPLGADFAYTDGVNCSRSVDAVLLGLTPCLSLGNIRARGLSIRFETAFGVGDDMPRVSILPLHGIMDITQNGAYIERSAIPFGMVIAEDNVTSVNTYSTNLSPFASKAKAYFQARMSSYPRHNYLNLEAPADSTVLFSSSWDVYGLIDTSDKGLANDTIGLLKQQWLQMLAKANMAESAADGLFAVKMDGTTFYAREVSVVTRENEYELLSHTGRWMATEPFQGIVQFNNKFDLSRHNFSELDKLLVMTPSRRSDKALSSSGTAEDVAKTVSADATRLTQ